MQVGVFFYPTKCLKINNGKKGAGEEGNGTRINKWAIEIRGDSNAGENKSSFSLGPVERGTMKNVITRDG